MNRASCGRAWRSGDLFQKLVASPQVELLIERSDGSQQRIRVTRQQIVEGLQQLE